MRLGRSRVLPAAACLAVAAAVAGCSSSSSSTSGTAVTAKGSTLVIYLSRPASMTPVQKQVLEAEEMACPTSAQPIPGGRLSVRCNPRPLAGRQLSDNARAAIQNESTIAYIGEIQPGTSAQTVGITNALDLLQVSPTDTATELTQPTQMSPRNGEKPEVSRVPSHYYETGTSYGRTFARIVPASIHEAAAQVAEMKKLGVKAVYVVNDGSDYGRVLAAAVRSDANAQGLAIQPSETAAGAIFYAGTDATAADHFAASASSTAVAEKLFLPSALAGLSFGTGGWTRFRSIYVSQPGVPASADRTFRSQFASRYGGRPGPQAVFGYVAVQAVLKAIDQAGKNAKNRTSVVRALHGLTGFPSALGPISINSNGDSSLGQSDFVFSRVRGGTLVPLR